MNWIDIGVNLTNKRFDNDREDLIKNALNAGVKQQIVTGTNLTESENAIQLCEQFPNVLFSTAGCHPHDAERFTEAHYSKLAELVKLSTVVAIGECGLDFNRNFSPANIQLDVFEQQLRLATKVSKPLFLHERDAFDQQLELLSIYRNKIIGGVVHCFTGSKEQLLAYLDLDLYIGITGWICDERRGQRLRDIIHLIPGNRLMIETDAPYLLPRDLWPKPKSNRNIPEYLPHIGRVIAHLRNVPVEQLSEQSYLNSTHFFGL